MLGTKNSTTTSGFTVKISKRYKQVFCSKLTKKHDRTTENACGRIWGQEKLKKSYKFQKIM
jgi:hypothetical protein